MQLECSLLKAATEGKWEVIQQAFHTPSQEEVVQRVRNKVIYAEGLVPCFTQLCVGVSFDVVGSINNISTQPQVDKFFLSTWGSYHICGLLLFKMI